MLTQPFSVEFFRRSGRGCARFPGWPAALLALLLLAAPSARGEDASQSLQQVTTLMKAGDFTAAALEARRLRAAKPDDPTLLRLEGVCLLETGNLDAAAALLGRAVALDPAGVAARYYLAQTHACRGAVLEAIELLRVVVSLAPGSEYARLSLAVIPELEGVAAAHAALSKGQRWSLSLRAGLEYDDNVPARADDDPDTSPTASWRLATSSYVELRILDQAIDRTPVTLGVGFSYYRTDYETKEFEDYAVESPGGSAFLDHRGTIAGMPYGVRVRGEYSIVDLGGDPYSTDWGAGATADLQWLGHALTSLAYAWEQQDFESDTTEPESYSRDGTSQTISASQTFFLWGDRISLGAEYARRVENADGSQFDLESEDVAAFLSLLLPGKFRLAGRYRLQQEDYVKYIPDPPRRIEDITTYRLTLSRRFWGNRIGLEGSFTHVDSQSNQEFSQYRRMTYGAALDFSF